MFRLVIFHGQSLVDVFEATSESVTIGRSSPCTIVLDSPSVSREHARIHLTGSGFEVVDLGSTNGVLVGGVRVRAAPVGPTTPITLGDFTIHVQPRTPAPAATATATATVPAESTRTLESLFLVSARFASIIDTQTIVGQMLDCLLDIFEAERGFVLLSDPRSGRLVPALARRIDPSGEEWPISQGIATQVFRSQTPVLTTDAQAQSPFSAYESVQRGELRSVVCVPLTLASRTGCLGVVYLDSRIGQRVFGAADLKLLDTFAAHAAQAIASTRERESLKKEVRNLKAAHREVSLKDHDVTRIVAVHPRMAEVMRQVMAVAPQDVTTLILGESGTGKELIAKAIHERSRRRDGPFIAVNCMALAPDVIESELFGHERGSFTGATERRVGRFELADGGTIFLDEIGELAPSIQVKLLRVLQENAVERVGSSRPTETDVRLIAATNADLKRLVKEGRFREDLFYRLNVFAVEIPPLRQRMEDLPHLVEHFVDHFNLKMARRVQGIAPDALAALLSYSWPGNVREVKNVIERAFVLEKDDRITIASIPYDLVAARGKGLGAQDLAIDSYPPDFHLAKELFEKNFILRYLRANQGNIARTAAQLGLPRKTIYRKLTAFGIPRSEIRDLAPEDEQD